MGAPAGVLAAQMAEPLRVTETLKPVSVKKLKPGVFIFDMGQNLVGWCRLRVTGPKGTQVTLRHAETLEPDGSLYVANLRSAKADRHLHAEGRRPGGLGAALHLSRLPLRGGHRLSRASPRAAALEGRVVHDDMERAGEFTSSNDLLNKIHHNMFWGIRGNYRSIPTDCPQRDERQGWLGDRGQVSRSESYMFDVAAFYSKWMTDLEDSQRPSGSIPDVSPNYWPLYNDDLTWPGTLIFVHGMLYDQYGDKRVLARGYDAMKKWIDYEKTFVKDGLISKDQYADWCVPPEDPKLIHSQDPARVTDKTLIATSYYYELLRQMSRYARILDKPTDAAEFDQLADADEGRLPAALLQAGEQHVRQRHADLRASCRCTSGWCRKISVRRWCETLVRNIEQKSDDHVGTGLVGAQWLMRTLSDNGQADLAYKIATQKTYPGWGYMVEQGATTDLGTVERQYRRPGDELRQPRDADRRPGGVDVRVPGGDPHRSGEAGLPARHHPAVSGGRPDVRQGDAQDDVRSAEQFVEAREGAVHARCHGAGEHDGDGVGAGEGRGGGDGIRQEGGGGEGREVREKRRRERRSSKWNRGLIALRVRYRVRATHPLNELHRERVEAVRDAVGLHVDQLVALGIGTRRIAAGRDDPRAGRAGRRAVRGTPRR